MDNISVSLESVLFLVVSGLVASLGFFLRNTLNDVKDKFQEFKASLDRLTIVVTNIEKKNIYIEQIVEAVKSEHDDLKKEFLNEKAKVDRMIMAMNRCESCRKSLYVKE